MKILNIVGKERRIFQETKSFLHEDAKLYFEQLFSQQQK